MKLLSNIIGWVLSQAIAALVCFLIYKYGLLDLTNVNMTYIHWGSIVVIISCIVPAARPQLKDKQDSESKINDFVSTLIRKDERKRT